MTLTDIQKEAEALNREAQSIGNVVDKLKKRFANEPNNAQREAERRRAEEIKRVADLTAKVQADMGPRYSPEKVERFISYHDNQKPVVEDLKALDLGQHINDGRGIIWFGPVGTGKDHMAARLLYRAASLGFLGRWVNGQELFGEFRDKMTMEQTEESILKPLTRPDVLVISDPVPPRGEPSNYNLQQLYRLVDRRYRFERATWVTLNVASADEADARLGPSSFSRLKQRALLLPCFWPDYREKE
jgi:DNA replication protein DnaC